MADKDKPKNGRRTIKGTRATPVSPQHKPTGKKDPGGFKSPGFKSEGFTGRAKEKKPRAGQSPPRVREKERKGGPPSQRPTSPGKKKAPKKPGYTRPSMPEGWEKWKDRFPKPKPGPRPERPKPIKPGRPKKPIPKPKWPKDPPNWGKQKPGPKPKMPPSRIRKPKKPMGKGRAK